MPRKASAVAKSTRFEDALEELEGLVRALESGEQSLEESLAQFERGVALARFCRQSLADAERQVQVLLEEDGVERLADLDDDPGAEASAATRPPGAAGPSGGASDGPTESHS